MIFLDKLVENEVLSDVHAFQNYELLPGNNIAITRFEFIANKTQHKLNPEKNKAAVKRRVEVEKTLAKRRRCTTGEVCDGVKDDRKEDKTDTTDDNITDTKLEHSEPVCAPVDDDGDFIGRRKPDTDKAKDDLQDTYKEPQTGSTEGTAFINIKHHLATDLQSVGEQVWLGALLLCDFILDNHQDFTGQAVVDLGAGTGLTSIVASLIASRVFCTDTGENVLQLAQDNVDTARLYHGLPGTLCPVDVRELDWFKGLQVSDQLSSGYSLGMEDIERIQTAPVLIAADVVYDDDITDAFFQIVWALLRQPPNKTLYISLEKRLVFTIEDLDVASPAYQHFHRKLYSLLGMDSHIDVHIEQIPTDFGQYFRYTRSKQLELWKVWTQAGVT